MPGGFSNKPKILRGAFVEYGLSIPPLMVVFQFNPEQLTRNRSLSFSGPNQGNDDDTTLSNGNSDGNKIKKTISLRTFHQQTKELSVIQRDQQVTVQEETINFDILLDATDRLNDGDSISEKFGIAPQLAALEAMLIPKDESLLGNALGDLLQSKTGYSFTSNSNPPLILFIWGRSRVLPVNINSLNITETDFNTRLDPIRAKVAVNVTVIEGKNFAYTYSKAMKEGLAVLNLANAADVANVIIPG